MKKYVLWSIDQLLIKCQNHEDYMNEKLDSDINDDQRKILEHDLSENENYIETFKSLIEKWTK